MADNTNELVVWQWNCASFKRRRAPLLHFIASQAVKPHVIMLQETLGDALTFPGYRVVSVREQGKRGLATLVAKKCSFQEHKLQLGNSKAEVIILEIIPNSWLKNSVFLLNVYSSPSDKRQGFASIMAKAVALARGAPIVVAGDFNAPHDAWGYARQSPKGNNLLKAVSSCSLELITDPQYPTRIGTSVVRDTTPDLAFVKNVAGTGWQNLQENLGSDHFIVAITLAVNAAPPREFKVTDWDAFRKLRKEDQDEYDSLDSLFARLKADANAATKVVKTNLRVDRMDARLAHLLEAKNSILSRWRTQRLNRRLRKKIAQLNREIEAYSIELSKQQWNEVCSSVDGQMRVGAKWNLLKQLLDESQSKGNQRLAIDRIVHNQKAKGVSEKALLKRLADSYLPLGPSGDADYPHYRGGMVAELDAPFTEPEICKVLHELNGRSAPGPDGISNKLLRNLDGKSIEKLTEEVNKIWETGHVPESWKTASVALIPKPGKPLALENMRPISLTSCVGKVAEHAIHHRVSEYIESRELFPHNMVGFRSALSTQDVMLLIKRQIIDNNTRDTRGILALDLAKAFDNISHKFVLEAISVMGLGQRFHAYVRSFLRDRRATIRIGQIQSTEFTLGARGTPQGAVISPLLFNIAMKGLSERLATVRGVNHALYADDITVWCMGGSDAGVEQALQEALDITENFLVGSGLSLSSAKSELLLYRPTRQGLRNLTPLEQIPIALYTRDGQKIPRVDSIRVLGLLLESKGGNSRTIARITSKTENMLRLILRVSNRRGGLSESNLLRLYHAFLMSHINYVASALRWSKREEARIDTLMRKSIKRVLGLPIHTSTEKLLQLGMHNSLSEVIEAQQMAQVVRLSSSRAGRRILESIGCGPTATNQRNVTLPPSIRGTFSVAPLPRNVHPQYNVGRRIARARSLLKSVANRPHLATFVDAAQYGRSDRFAVVSVDHSGTLLCSASVRKVSAMVAEQIAIAIAMKDPSRPNVFTDSRSAARAFASGSISREAAAILGCEGAAGFHTITWFPAHMGANVHPDVPNANEFAHDRARGIAHRGGPGGFAGGDAGRYRDSLLTFHEIMTHYHLSRRAFPLPHPKLTRPQSSAYRMLQTGSFPSRGRFSHFSPNIEPHCPDCGEAYCSLPHMLWQCPALRDAEFNKEEDWEEALNSGDLLVQLRAVQRACERAEGHGLPVPTWERPATATDSP